MSRSTISTFKLFQMFPDEETAPSLPRKPSLARSRLPPSTLTLCLDCLFRSNVLTRG